jgi:hypothetical protein
MYPLPTQRYNIKLFIEKEYPDLNVWDGVTFNPHPNAVHDYIWHRALANLALVAEKQKRELRGERNVALSTRIEILNAQFWQAKKIEDERAIKSLSRSMLADLPTNRGMRA